MTHKKRTLCSKRDLAASASAEAVLYSLSLSSCVILSLSLTHVSYSLSHPHSPFLSRALTLARVLTCFLSLSLPPSLHLSPSLFLILSSSPSHTHTQQPPKIALSRAHTHTLSHTLPLSRTHSPATAPKIALYIMASGSMWSKASSKSFKASCPRPTVARAPIIAVYLCVAVCCSVLQRLSLRCT